VLNVTQKKTIWIVHQYASTPETGMGGRHFYLAQELAKQGHKVYAIASSSSHLLHTQPKLTGDMTFEAIAGFTFIWVKMPVYTEAHSKKRVLNWFLFPWRIQKLVKLIKDKPDVVLCSSPSLIAFLGAQRIAKKFSAKLAFEVRDIWPLTLTELGGFSVKHPFIRFMQWVENKAYRDSDLVISNLKGSVEHMVEHGLDRDKFTWIPNGFSLEEVNNKVPLSSLVTDKLPKGKFIIGYTGTLGVANSLDTLISAAEILKEYKEINFVLVGKGKERDPLEKSVKRKGLENVFFLNAVPKVQIQSMLNKFHVCYIGWNKEDLYRFGIGANKIPEYLYSGKPILHSYSGRYDSIFESQAGISVEAESPVLLADAILRLYSMSVEKREMMGKNGHKAALLEYEYSMLAKKLSDILCLQR
jgi:glycosyltransferase involved in cell wall biosynthesis